MVPVEASSVRCTACDKVVYQMEQMKAENQFWHRNCFRCTTCNKALSVDTYQSHEGILYCKPHFKQLFSPKTVLDSENDEVDVKKGAFKSFISSKLLLSYFNITEFHFRTGNDNS